jgi:hypothetical protein
MDAKAQEKEQQAYAQQAAIDNQYQMEQMQQQMVAMQAQQAQMAAAAAAAAAAPPPPPAPAPAPAPAAAAPAPDLMAQLQQLAQMRDAGILSDEEFAAAKAKLLGG